MGTFDDYQFVAKEKWVSRFNSFLAYLSSYLISMFAGKADSDHTHGAGGEVVSIGTSGSRPTVADGFIHSETDTDQLVTLNADGSLRARAAMAATADLLGLAAGNRIVDGGCRITDASAPSVSGSRQYGQLTMFAGWADGSPSAGTIGNASSSWAASGTSVGILGLTQTGAGSKAYFSQRIEGQSIADLAGEEVTFACKVYHDTGAAIDWVITLNSADVADDFSSVTQIAVSDAESVADSTATEITLTATLTAAAANGLEIIVEARCGAVTTKNFYVSGWRLYPGGTAPPMALLPIADERARVARYYRFGSSAAGCQDDLLFSGDVTSGNTYWAQVQFGVPMRTTPTVAATSVGASGFAASAGTIYKNAQGIAEVRTATGTATGGIFASTWTADARL